MGMIYGKVTGVGKPVSRLVQGTMPLSEDDVPGSLALLDAVYEHGCRAFDTAHGYGGGACERLLGRWINERGVRDEVVILGKGAHPYDGRQRVTPEDITSDLHESLQRLGVDSIDMYVLHRDNPELPVGPIVDVLNEHKTAGKIGVFGGSNWAASRIAEANAYAAENGLEGFTVSSPNFSLALARAERDRRSNRVPGRVHRHSIGYRTPHWARRVSIVSMIESDSSSVITGLSTRPSRRQRPTSIASYW